MSEKHRYLLSVIKAALVDDCSFAQGECDIEELFEISKKHQIVPLVFHGLYKLKGSDVRAHDLRAGAAMVLAALAAKGTTEIEEIQYIERGYEDIVEKLRGLGADIRRVTETEAIAKQA